MGAIIRAFICGLGLLLVVATPVSALPVILDIIGGGRVAGGFETMTLGWEFAVGPRPIVVGQLGVWDDPSDIL